jgi:NAD+ synthetase
MIYLYNLASIHRGLVIDTDNLTEHNLGYWTVHGDVGDFNPIGGLWKTEVFELAQWLFDQYKDSDYTQLPKAEAMWASLQLKPTAGLGITNNDLEELGAESYEQVDAILQEILAWKSFNNPDITFKSLEEEKLAFLDEQQMLCYPMEVIIAIAERHFKSEFKRKRLPITISRYLYTR